MKSQPAGDGPTGEIAHTEEAPALDLLTPAEVWTAREEKAKASGGDPSDSDHRMPVAQRVTMFLSVVGPLAGMAVAINGTFAVTTSNDVFQTAAAQ